MTLRAVINNYEFGTLISYEVSRSVEDLAGAFSIEMSHQPGTDPPIHVADPIKIMINSTTILTGYIEKLRVSYTADSHSITISGRDKVADLIDSTVGHKIELKAPVTLERILQTVMKEISLTGVKVINQAGVLAPFLAGDMVSGQVDETIFDFLEKYTRKRQVLMTTDGKGNIVLARTGSKRAAVPLLHLIDDYGQKNNVLESSFEWDESKKFHTYRIHSQGNPTAGNKLGVSSNKEVTNRLATAYDPTVRPTRFLDLSAESSTDSATLQKRAEWEAIVRFARGFSYSCKVYGHEMTPNGAPWEPNMLALVQDEFGLTTDVLLIKSVKHTLDCNSGSTTELELVDPDSYLPEPITEKKRKGRKIGRKKRGKKDKLVKESQRFISNLDGGK